MVIRVRIAWGLLAAVSAALEVYAACLPMYQYTSCEKINYDAVCRAPAYLHQSPGLLILLVIPAALCLIPGAFPRRAAAAAVAATMILTFGLLCYFSSDGVGGFEMLLTMLGAAALTTFHPRLARSSSANTALLG